MSDAAVVVRTRDEVDDGGKRRQILDGARTVFLTSGFDGASMNEIARVAGVSKGTLYVYFDSKEELFEALIRQDKQAQAEQTCNFEHDGDDVRATLTEIGTRLMVRMLDPDLVAQFRTVIAVSAKFPRIGQAYFESGPRYGMGKLANYLREQVEAGHLAIADVEAAAYQFADLCKSRYLLRAILCVDDAPPAAAELKAHVQCGVDVFLKAYGVGDI